MSHTISEKNNINNNNCDTLQLSGGLAKFSTWIYLFVNILIENVRTPHLITNKSAKYTIIY